MVLPYCASLVGQGKPFVEVGNYAKCLDFFASTQMGELIELDFRKITTFSDGYLSR